jgi:L-seryl-tRNA(Ser) seleniumtransferase
MSLYSELGVREYINAYGTVTRYGGSIMHPDVSRAMEEASRSFISMDEFHLKAGERIASLLGCEAAFVTCGAEAGIVIASAAVMAGTDIARILALPESSSMKHEVIVMKSHRSRYDQGILVAGGDSLRPAPRTWFTRADRTRYHRENRLPLLPRRGRG